MAEELPRIPKRKLEWLWKMRDMVRLRFCRRCEFYRHGVCTLLEDGIISVRELLEMVGCRYFKPRTP